MPIYDPYEDFDEYDEEGRKLIQAQLTKAFSKDPEKIREANKIIEAAEKKQKEIRTKFQKAMRECAIVKKPPKED